MSLLEILGYVPVVLGVTAQVAAAVGTPSIVTKVKVVHNIFNLFAGNYGKAKNR